MTEPASPFEHSASFSAGEIAAGVRLDGLEAQYESLFAEVIEDGVITADERARLDRAAAELGLDRARLAKLEQALTAAYEARRKVRVREVAATTEAPPDAGPASIMPLETPDARSEILMARVRMLEDRVRELEAEVEELRSQAAVEVDFSGVASAKPAASDDPDEILRRLRLDPRDPELLHALYRALGEQGDPDRRYNVAAARVFLGTPDPEARALVDRHRPEGLVRPRSSLTRDAWIRLLFHPEQEPVVGEIFAAVLGPVMLGRMAALRRDGLLPRVDPATRQDPATSTVAAVRSVAWAAAILGVQAPPIHVDPSAAVPLRMIPAATPALRLGKPALSGRTPAELAFLAGEHLAYFRDDAFMRALFDSITELEDVFLAALSIGNPGLPLAASVRARVAPLAEAIAPLLDAVKIDRLRGAFLRFVEDGGRANLQRWATAVDATAARAGLLLSGDLRAAEAMLRLEDPANVDARVDDLILFSIGERYTKLRVQIGIAVG
jgi:hypothetical protein